MSHVTIRETNLQRKLKFSAERWIDEKEDDRKLEVELYPDDNKQMKDLKTTATTNNRSNNDNHNSNIDDISGELKSDSFLLSVWVTQGHLHPISRFIFNFLDASLDFIDYLSLEYVHVALEQFDSVQEAILTETGWYS